VTRLRACAFAAALALAACGKYGPPVREAPGAKPPGAPNAPPAAAAPNGAPVSAAPTTSDPQQCSDPNAVPTEATP
jgi:hypothetical protein